MTNKILESIERDFFNEEEEEIEEVNTTGNIDGGAGPPKTPGAFSRSGEEDENDNAEWFGAKKVKPVKRNFTRANGWIYDASALSKMVLRL